MNSFSAADLMGELCGSNFMILAGEHCFLQQRLDCALRVPDKGQVID
jgi:hypothetical protein